MINWLLSYLGLSSISGYEEIIYILAGALVILAVTFFYDIAQKILLNVFKK